MGVSFKISKTGNRFKPKPCLQSEVSVDDVSEKSKESSRPRKLQVNFIKTQLSFSLPIKKYCWKITQKRKKQKKREILVKEILGFVFLV